MDKDFVKYYQALAMEDLGFNKECIKIFNGNEFLLDLNESAIYATPAPLKYQVFNWFRENYDLWSWISPIHHNDGSRYFYYEIINEGGIDKQYQGQSSLYCEDNPNIETFEEAEIACIDKLIELVNKPKYELYS